MKKRLDLFLVERGFFDTREKAKANIMAGLVFVDEQMVDKAGTLVKESSSIKVRGDAIPYVSRGGLKLEKAIIKFNLNLNDKICMDIGASTGGFTDCMLQKNAKKVYSIDVGYGQLDYKLRNNPKVVNIERTNFRYIDESLVTDKIDFVSVDVSFISIKLILPKLKIFLKDNFEVVALIKPQFEAGKKEADKHSGIIKDKSVCVKVIKEIIDSAEDEGFYIRELTFSPIKGQKGNIEFLAYFTNVYSKFDVDNIDKVVSESHDNLLS